MAILALITDEGAACADGLCTRCHEDQIAREQVEWQQKAYGDISEIRWREVNNPEVSCVICGATIEGGQS